MLSLKFFSKDAEGAYGRNGRGDMHMLTQGLQQALERFWEEDASCWGKLERLLRVQEEDAAKRDAIVKALDEYTNAQKQFLKSAWHFAREEDCDWLLEEMERAQRRLAFHVPPEVRRTYHLPSGRAMLDAPSSTGEPLWLKYESQESEVCGRLDAEELVNETAGVQAALKRLTESLAKRA